MSLPTAAQQQAARGSYDDDKYAKANMNVKLSGDAEKAASLSLKDLGLGDFAAVLRSPVQLYAAFLMMVSVWYYSVGGSLRGATTDLQIGYVSCFAETCGLLILHRKITQQKSVAGISASSVVMYFVVYVLRQYVMLPAFTWIELDNWLTTILQMPQIFLTGAVLHLIYNVHRSSYQESLDVVKAWQLVPACVLLSLPLHPFFREGFAFSYEFGCYMWLDVLALLPQVIMMAQGAGKVEAPIAHFVAATTLSRCTDLSFWYYNFDQGLQGYLFGINYTGILIVSSQVISLLLVADFMYYYIKARLSGKSLAEDLDVSAADDMC
eukprot:TRINITY_DN3262_c0_g3_i1.p1 TRINITY_DN3262_c0_g3~~TRINITY_DN3262_c0_g3_i1.p1  ORF type:complete len:349 (-),score=82.43 TRINITY_DN3262_c0_g3_i1:90-1058(-)